MHGFVSDIAIFVLKGDIKLQLTVCMVVRWLRAADTEMNSAS